jgi:anti-anti-sigma factor
MSIQKFSEDVILVDLPFKEPDIGHELQAINDIISGRDDCDVIVDFFRVEIITSSSLSNLIILRKLMLERGRELILCNVSHVTKYIFTVANLDTIFEFVDDKLAALAAV